MDFPEAEMEQATRKIYEAVFALQQNQFSTEWVRWRFESADAYCTAKPGIMAVVLVGKDVANAAEIERLLREAPI